MQYSRDFEVNTFSPTASKDFAIRFFYTLLGIITTGLLTNGENVKR